jgi:hypothetical protein
MLQGGRVTMVNSISHNQILHSLSTTQSSSLELKVASSRTENGTQTMSSDTISLRSEATQTVTYSESLQLHADERTKYGMLQSLVANLLKEQGINTKITIGDTEIDLTALNPDEAKELISEDGYFGVEQTSERIFQFAVGIAGGDPSRIDAIKEGIDKGFAEAKEAFGDWLPDISYDTYDAVMKKLDAWVAESKAVA